MDIDTVTRFVHEDAAFRRRQRLQPVGGKGDKIFPPTYPGDGRNAPPRHVYERRQLNGHDTWCVLIDSVQSQANRLEECLREAIREGLSIPHVVVDFRGAGLDGVTEITSLDAPHRVYDAIMRDSLLNGEPFMKTAVGRNLATARQGDASAVLQVSPTALLFGAWHSTGEGGGLGAKFARCLISEITAVQVPVEEVVNQRTGEVDARTAGRRPGSRIDPLGVLRKVEVFKGKKGWDTTASGAGAGSKRVRPSEINHGNIAPSIQPLGITCDHIEHSFVLSFAALRRLHFGTDDRDLAGRALIAALGLLAIVEQDKRGYALRSRCDLVCEGRAPLELVHPDGTTDALVIDRDSAKALYRDACEAAKKAGFGLPTEPLLLTPQDKLIEIVRRSQELALLGEGGDVEEASDEQ
jgi:CRISPR-associated protein Csb1